MRRRLVVMAARHSQYVAVAVAQLDSRTQHARVGKALQQVPLKISFGIRCTRVSDVTADLANGTNSRQAERQRLDQVAAQGLRDIVIEAEYALGAIAFVAAKEFVTA